MWDQKLFEKETSSPLRRLALPVRFWRHLNNSTILIFSYDAQLTGILCSLLVDRVSTAWFLTIDFDFSNKALFFEVLISLNIVLTVLW